MAKSVGTNWANTVAPSGTPKSRNIMLLVVLGVLAIVVGLSVTGSVVLDFMDDRAFAANRTECIAIRRLEVAIAEADAATLGYILTSQAEYLATTFEAERRLSVLGPTLVQRISAPNAAGVLSALREAWQVAIELVRNDRPGDVLTALRTAHARELSTQMHEILEAYYDRQAAADVSRAAATDTLKHILRGMTLMGILLGVVMVATTLRRIGRAIGAGQAARRQIEQLFAMGDMLQSATDMDDTNAVLRSAVLRLLPGLSGALYVFNNSRDRLDLATRWGALPAGQNDHIAPASCGALKRGNPHLNEIAEGALRCAHSNEGLLTLDIPMTARGQLHGVLEIAADGSDACRRLEAARPIATAIGDAMSLALSNAALRDQLRNQALRDGLTSLYNRRFLEEVQERLCLDSERRGSSIALIMLDLDRFKVLKDTHGHGAGDTALREVAAAMMSCVRATDIACRYGGEELLVLLPDCGLEMAAGKAEQIHSRIASLTFEGGMSVTASFGIAAIPETSATARSLLTDADVALYQAKTGGRDRAAMAPRREMRVEAKVVALAEVA
jgi:diguanylate cyclase (GGDEF)-like protein